MHRLLLLAWVFLGVLTPLAHADTPALSWKLLNSIHREPDHFTQGLVYADQKLFESTGRYGQSRLIAYDASTLIAQKTHHLPTNVFGEGLTFLNGKLYQSSWKSHQIFVYDTALNLLQTLHIDGDSWGLTTDGHLLIMSNGSEAIQFLDPDTGMVLNTIIVTDNSGKQQQDINELEWINGKILANIWHSNTVLVIDSSNGHITGQFDLQQLSQNVSQHMPQRSHEQVLNGMAWNSRAKTLLVTGKDWPLWFEISLELF